MGGLDCRNPTLAAHQYFGILNEFTLWPLMLRRKNLAVAAEKLVEETIKMFLKHSRRHVSVLGCFAASSARANRFHHHFASIQTGRNIYGARCSGGFAATFGA